MIFKVTQLVSGVAWIWTQICFSPKPLPILHQLPHQFASHFSQLTICSENPRTEPVHSLRFSLLLGWSFSFLPLVPESLLLRSQSEAHRVVNEPLMPCLFYVFSKCLTTINQLFRNGDGPRSWISAVFVRIKISSLLVFKYLPLTCRT